MFESANDFQNSLVAIVAEPCHFVPVQVPTSYFSSYGSGSASGSGSGSGFGSLHIFKKIL
jgi:hypothetical protein